MKQLGFFAPEKTTFGGSLLKGKRKSRRPLNARRPLHLVLKATNPFQLLRHKDRVELLVRKYSEKFDIKVYGVGVQADHAHLSLRIPNRTRYVQWIRSLTSVLTQAIAGLKWRLRPFTRISAWGRAFVRLREYIKKNKTEGEFIVSAFKTVELWRERALTGPTFQSTT